MAAIASLDLRAAENAPQRCDRFALAAGLAWIGAALCVLGAAQAATAASLPALASAELPPALRTAAAEAMACVDALPATLTLIDYSQPSTARRLWTFDLSNGALLFHERVAHGQGSGGDLATRFSNRAGSRQTSLGLFRTAESYVGDNGYSLRLDGLDAGINDQARARAIVIHGAAYVSDAAIASWGRIGRSWGCPAVSAAVARKLIDRIRGGSYLLAWHPDHPITRACAG